MPLHVLLLVNTYVTEKDPRRGAKFRLQLKAYNDRGYKVGLVAFMQRDYRLTDCLLRGGLIWEDEEFGVPIVRDCTYNALPVRSLLWRSQAVASGYTGLRSLRYYIKNHGRPDIIHAHGSHWSGVAANAIQDALGIPYVVTEHMTRYAAGKVESENLPLMRKVFSEARMRLPIGESTGELLEKIFGDDFRPWTVIPNMVDVALFTQPPPRESSAGDPFIFFSAGRFDRIKGFDILIEAFAAEFKGKNVLLRIGGDGQQRDELHALTEKLDIAGQVEFLGKLPRERVAVEFGRVDAYVLASRHETFGIPVVEAHASGVPVVATACGVHQKLIDASNGLWVQPESVDAMAEGMALMMRRHGEFDRNAIRKGCLASYSPQAVLDQLETIYDTALNSKDA